MKLRLLPLLLLLSAMCRAQSFTVWGTTAQGGANGLGTLFGFSYIPNGGSGSGQYEFSDTAGIGYNPGPVMMGTGRVLYGTTTRGGLNNTGTIYGDSLEGLSPILLHNFAGPDSLNNTGFGPVGALVAGNDSLLYGVTDSGGAFYPAFAGGVLFSYNIGTGAYTVLHNFKKGGSATSPVCRLTMAGNGLLYGLTTDTGTTSGANLFSYNPATAIITPLHTFDTTMDGYSPAGSLVQGNNDLLYGVNSYTAHGKHGVIFSYNINTGAFNNLYYFNPDSALYPSGPLLWADNGLLYGLTNNGVAYGTLYSYNPVSGAENTVHRFGGMVDSDLTDGTLPLGPLTTGPGAVYGTTYSGGNGGLGTVFSYNTDSGVYHVPASFGSYFIGILGGINPSGALIYDTVSLLNTSPHPFCCPAYENLLVVFPNPSPGIFTVEVFIAGETALSYELEIFDVLGKKIYDELLGYGQSSVDLSREAAGVYFLRLHTSKGIKTAKLVLSR